MEQVRLGIIGVGNMGSGHCENILAGKTPEIRLAAVADRREARRDWAKGRLGEGVAVFTEGSQLIQSGLCDAVLIAVPHYQHPVLAKEAFAQGLHVMCEKPAGVYTKAVREMNAAADESGRVFGMMFNQRTNCLYREMRRMVQGGELGELKRVNWIITDWYRTQIYYDSGDWRATWDGEGGGVLLNQCPHQLDLLQWICGLPTKVQAFCQEGKWHDIEVEDDVTAYLEFANGATGVFVTTTGDAPGTNRFEVSGTLGKLVCEDGKLTFWKLKEDERTFCREAKEGFAMPEMEKLQVETDGENPQHVRVLNAFAANILRGEPLVADGREGINGLTLSNAMHLSSWLQKPVGIPFDEELFLNELNKRRANSRKKAGADITFSTEGTY
ncbi:gfo/Idh/MocA family oxidoreductase [Acutalibacter sp. 1XD8-33]|uniref:Gfo/Idh/MocA family protein n=1 Tax=Acutalibacter sp. 1XD8-33 TaxID=2320081 RepID=UPI000EA2AFEF|nr:Gfo/Idh/MocA family oxidoreductase [Acutalibacter sp. 1XD8-33]RKJ41814.1 gfo/Idh/MocA family oxidoreductase [Acutalibacter sp. 1XD8-33]